MVLGKRVATVKAVIQRVDTGQPLLGPALVGFESMPSEAEHLLVAQQELIVVLAMLIVYLRGEVLWSINCPLSCSYSSMRQGVLVMAHAGFRGQERTMSGWKTMWYSW